MQLTCGDGKLFTWNNEDLRLPQQGGHEPCVWILLYVDCGLKAPVLDSRKMAGRSSSKLECSDLCVQANPSLVVSCIGVNVVDNSSALGMMTIRKDSCKPTKLSGLELECDHNDICNMPTLGHDALKHEYCFELTAVILEQNVIQSGNEDFKETSPVFGIAVCRLRSRSTNFGYSEDIFGCSFPGSLKISSAMCTSISILC